jgi:hypothetical protein
MRDYTPNRNRNQVLRLRVGRVDSGDLQAYNEEMIRGWITALILVSVIVPGLSWAQVYHWVDEKGIQYYTTEYQSIPEKYQSTARSLPLSPPPSPPPELPAIPPQNTVTKIPFVPGFPVLVSTKINGAGPITLILDTGADRTVVAPSVLWKLGVSTVGAQRGLIKGVTGMSYVDAVWVNSVEVGETKVGPLLVVAHDADLKGADGLLGRDFLAKFNVTIDSAERVVTLAPN